MIQIKGSYLGIFLGISMLVFADIIEIISWLGGALYFKNASKKVIFHFFI